MDLYLLLLPLCVTASNRLLRWRFAFRPEHVIENRGTVCFESLDSTAEVRGSYTPAGCFPSSCTAPVEQSLVARVNQSQSRIRFRAHTVVVWVSGPQVSGCTADCGGAGRVPFNLGVLQPGTYAVWLGQEQIGSITVPSLILPQSPFCLESSHTPLPTPVITPSPTWPTITPPPVATSIFYSPVSPLPRPTATPVPLPNPTTIPTPLADPSSKVEAVVTPMPDLSWTEDLEPILIQGYVGQWSPVANEILLAHCSGSVTDTIHLARAPGFVPDDITPDNYACSPSREHRVLLWTADGEHIILVMPDATSHGTTISSGRAAMMDRQGEDLRSINDAATSGPMPELYGWLDDQTLVYDHYEGGGYHHVQALDVYTGERILDAGLSGTIEHISAGYLCATSYDEEYPRAVALGPVARTGEHGEPDGSVIYYPSQSQTEAGPVSTYCQGWHPGTNEMLVLSARQESGRRFPNYTELVFWNVQENVMSTAAPDAVAGQVSPDGRWLAYVTLGPARLDAAGRPIPSDLDLDQVVFDPYNVIRYLHLLDLETGQVTMSLPTLDGSYSGEYVDRVPGAFSPNSRYLAFVTPGPTKLDADERPTGLKDGFWSTSYLVVVEVATGQMVYLAPARGMVPVWVHNSRWFVYRDEQENLVLFDLATTDRLQITQSGGACIQRVDWSFDDRYLALQIQCLGTRQRETAILHVPFLAPTPSAPGLAVWLTPRTYQPDVSWRLQVEYETAKWDIDIEDSDYPKLVHRDLGCWIVLDRGRGLPDGYSLRDTMRKLGDIQYSVREVRWQEKLVDAMYAVDLDGISALFRVNVGEDEEMCIYDAEAVLVTLKVVAIPGETDR